MRVTPICIGDDRVTLPEREGEPMATVGAKAVERGEGEAICTDGGVGNAPHPPPEGVREMGVGKSCCGEGAVRRQALGLGQGSGPKDLQMLHLWQEGAEPGSTPFSSA